MFAMYKENTKYTAFRKAHTWSCRSVHIWQITGEKKDWVNDDSLSKHIINIDRPQKDAYAKCPLGFAGTVCPGQHPVLFIPAGQDRCL